MLLLGPITNYLFLRYMGGDNENEKSQARRYTLTDADKMAQFNKYRREKNAVWPTLGEMTNVWTWGVLALGVGAVALDRAARRMF